MSPDRLPRAALTPTRDGMPALRMTGRRGVWTLTKAVFSLEVFPFAVLIALSLISILSRLWLALRPLFAPHAGP